MMIKTIGLTKAYGDLVALDGLNLEVEAGEIFGFIGPNGAGKTTTIHILATLLEPTSGEALIDGHEVRARGREVRRLVGYLPDFFGVYPSLRVWEYLEFFAAAYEVPAGDRLGILGDVLDLTGLEEKRDALVGDLSRGMQQRLGLARVLIHDPKVLLLDEPASGLDPRARLEMREILRELQTMGKTILISSHILSELAEMCSTIGIVDHGKLLAAGPVDKVLDEVGAATVVRAWIESPEGDAADNQALVQALADMPHVEEVEDRGPAPEGPGQEIRIETAAGADLVPELAAFFVGRGLRLRHLESERLDLEEAYLRLTAGYAEDSDTEDSDTKEGNDPEGTVEDQL